MNTIVSLNNQIIKDLVRLKKAGERKDRGLIIIDGAREIKTAVEAGVEIVALFYCPELVKNPSAPAGNFFNLSEEKIIKVSEAVFDKICYKENPDGFLATAQPQQTFLADIKLKNNPLIVILEAVEKPGNLGAILRTAYAADATAVIINDSQTDIYNPNVIRASEGCVFAKTIVKAETTETISWLKENKIKSFGAATGGLKSYTKADLRGAAAIVFGSESEGLSEQWLRAAEELIKIPMKKGIDSLNVSVSAAVILYEALRQRER
ncbi:MAG: RNA methyltransferase [Patescibacteria group bacterium]